MGSQVCFVPLEMYHGVDDIEAVSVRLLATCCTSWYHISRADGRYRELKQAQDGCSLTAVR